MDCYPSIFSIFWIISKCLATVCLVTLVIRFVGMELHILLDLPCFIQRVADDALHKLLEDLFAVVQPDLVASYTLHLLVQCFFYCLCSVSCRIAWWLVYRWKQYVGGFLPAYITSY